jgi:hypothetical protein
VGFFVVWRFNAITLERDTNKDLDNGAKSGKMFLPDGTQSAGHKKRDKMTALKIKIDIKHAAALEAALAAVNGKAKGHTYTDACELIDLAAKAEAELENLHIRKEARGDSIYTQTSGGKVANAYNNMRIATQVKFRRGSSAWYLVDVKQVRVGTSGGGKSHLSITSYAEQAMIQTLRQKYTLSTPIGIA